MKNLRKLTALLLALAMVLSLGLAVFATPAAYDGEYSITVTVGENDTAKHDYSAYQVFGGDLAEDEDGSLILSNIVWGSNIPANDGATAETYAEMIEALQAIDGLDECETAAEFAAALTEANAAEFAAVIEAYLVGEPAGTASSPVTNAEEEDTAGEDYVPAYGKSTKVTVPSAGYYLIKDEIDGVGSKTKYVLRVLGEEDVASKSDVPSVDKEILDPTETKYNEAGVGETITYQLKSQVPDMTYYNNYWFVYHDTLSKGLDYTGNVNITIDGGDPLKGCTLTAEELEKHGAEGDDNCDYYVVVSDGDDGETKIDIIFRNFKQWADKVGKDIIVTYTAELNVDAVIGPNGNPNEVDLEFSNNPNFEYDEDYDEDEDDVTGRTPESRVITYTTGLEIIKVDETGEHRLTGAQFSIKGTVNKKYIVETEKFTENNETGTYYKLKDGSYTDEEPKPETQDKYESTTVKYEKEVVKTIEEGEEEEFEVTATVGDDGTLIFEGLADGTYTIKEIVAPDGYNLLEEEITLVVKSKNMNETSCDWEVGDGSTEGWKYNDDGDYLYKLAIKNNKGTQLPGTGGMGTYTFYAVGGMMILAALAVLVVKTRTSKEK